MGVRAPESRDAVEGSLYDSRRYHVPVASAVVLGVVVLLLLLSNGRPIESGDTRVNAQVAGSLAQHLDFTLDEYPDADLPFAREVGGHRVSVYPALGPLVAAPVFFVAHLFFRLDDTGLALAGKLAASLFAALAATLLYAAIGRRHPSADARFAAVVFALGTAIWSTSQGLWQHPVSVLFLSLALLFVIRAEADDAWAARAGLPLALAVAARQADVALVAVLALGIALRWPRRIPGLVLWGLPPVLFVLGYQWALFGSPLEHGFSGTLSRFSEPWGRGQLGLLLSPAKGLLVFTPVVIVAVCGMVRALRRGERFLPVLLGTASLAHLVFIGRWSEWHGGESFGPRLMTDALPLLFVFLPEGIAATGGVGVVLAAFGIAVQALGAFADDGRWERLYQRPAAPGHPELWDVARSPLPTYARRAAFVFAMPGLRDGAAVIREHPVAPLAPRGSRIAFQDPGRILAKSADVTLTDAYPMRGARVDESYLRLLGRWDALFVRVAPEAHARRLELRVSGHGKGVLYVGERSFWSPRTRFRAYPISGPFRIRHPYFYPDSGGGDLLITVGRGDGVASLASVALVPPGDPDDVYELR